MFCLCVLCGGRRRRRERRVIGLCMSSAGGEGERGMWVIACGCRASWWTRELAQQYLCVAWICEMCGCTVSTSLSSGISTCEGCGVWVGFVCWATAQHGAVLSFQQFTAPPEFTNKQFTPPPRAHRRTARGHRHASSYTGRHRWHGCKHCGDPFPPPSRNAVWDPLQEALPTSHLPLDRA